MSVAWLRCPVFLQSEKGRAAPERRPSQASGCRITASLSEPVVLSSSFCRVAYTPAAAPFVKPALNAPYTPVGRAAGFGVAVVSLAAPPQAVAVQTPAAVPPPSVTPSVMEPPPMTCAVQFDRPARIDAVTPEARDHAFEGRIGTRERHRQVDIGVEMAGGAASCHFLATGVSHPCDRHANGITLVRG